MKNVFQSFMIILLILFSLNTIYSQDQVTDKLAVKFADPNKPGFIKASLINGGITVTGYDGKEVIVEATIRSKKISFENMDSKTKGMKRIAIKATGLSIEEENNEMEISVESMRRSIDLNIRAPRKTSLKLNCINAGNILVKNITGEIDVDNINGKVILEDISGAVVAHALNKDLTVTLNKVEPRKSMSFSTLNGDIDVTFPGDMKADVKLKSDNGEVYSDFEIQLNKKPHSVVEENGREKGGKYKVRIDRTISGTINGGGPEFQFTSFNGDIFIRKNK